MRNNRHFVQTSDFVCKRHFQCKAHIHARLHTIKQYSKLLADSEATYVVPKRELAVTKRTVYQGPVLTINQYWWHTPDGNEIERDIVERPESVLALPARLDAESAEADIVLTTAL